MTCNSKVEVATEDHVTLNCTLFILDKKKCRIDGYVWRNTTAHKLCKADAKMYKCDCDNMTYVSLTIFKPVEENYTVLIQATCGEHKLQEKECLRPRLDSASFSHQTKHFCRGSAFLLYDNGLLAPLKLQTFDTWFQGGIL